MSDQYAAGVPGDVTISRWLYVVLREAYRMVSDQGRLIVGTGDVLAGMAEGLPDLGRVLRLPTPPGDGAFAGGRARPGTPSAHLPEVRGPLRLAAWEVAGSDGVKPRKRPEVVPGWDEEVASCLGEAFDLALVAGQPRVGNRHLLEVFLRPGSSQAHDLISGYSDLAALDQFRYSPWPDKDAKPYDFVADYLASCRLLAPSGRASGRPPRWPALALRVAAHATFPYYRLEQDAAEEAVKLGHPQVLPVHLLLAALVMETRVAASGLDWVPPYDRFNSPVLTPAGASWHQVVRVLPQAPAREPVAPPRPRRAWRQNPTMPPWSVAAARMADRGRELAARQAELGLHHLVRAMLTDEDDTVGRTLAALGIDPTGTRLSR